MDIEAFYAEDERRRHSAELEFGRDWQRRGGRCEVSWVEDTGELYVMREPNAAVTGSGAGDLELVPMSEHAARGRGARGGHRTRRDRRGDERVGRRRCLEPDGVGVVARSGRPRRRARRRRSGVAVGHAPRGLSPYLRRNSRLRACASLVARGISSTVPGRVPGDNELEAPEEMWKSRSGSASRGGGRTDSTTSPSCRAGARATRKTSTSPGRSTRTSSSCR